MEQLLAIFAVWAIWSLVATLFEGSEWVWIVLPLTLGLAAQCLIAYHDWWLGLGIGGAAILVMRVADLLLVATDWVRVNVLRNQRR